jgi:N-acetylmuramic acid 6-phosphate etherase
MITTATMIRLGHIRDNKMVDMQMTNKKLKQRAVGILKEHLSISEEEAINLISENKSIRKSIDKYNSNE